MKKKKYNSMKDKKILVFLSIIGLCLIALLAAQFFNISKTTRWVLGGIAIVLILPFFIVTRWDYAQKLNNRRFPSSKNENKQEEKKMD